MRTYLMQSWPSPPQALWAVYGEPLPPPQRGTHWGDLPRLSPPVGYDVDVEVNAYWWSRGHDATPAQVCIADGRPCACDPMDRACDR